SYNQFLNLVFGLPFSDTHGLKLLRREAVVSLARECLTGNEIFDSELLIRAFHQKLKVKELPVRVTEGRPPRLALRKRIIKTLRDLLILFWVLRILPIKNYLRFRSS